MTEPKKRKVDRRIQRTRQLLRDALMQLIIETEDADGKSYDAITIQDIADKANVARTTFYLHYKDKDELLFEGMREIYDGLWSQVHWGLDSPLDSIDRMGDPTDFKHVAQHADFYRVMLSEKGSASFLMRVRQYLAQMMLENVLKPVVADQGWTPNVSLEMYAYLMAGSLIGVMKWWLDSGLALSPEEVALQMEQAIVFGMPWALGMQYGQSASEE